MVGIYVRVRNGFERLVRRVSQEDGLTIIEYVVFAAFVIVGLAAVAFAFKDPLQQWMGDTMCSIMAGQDKAYNITTGKCA
ncbi:MAG: Flp family type IVb pilin [Bacillota bacterium]